MPYAEKRRCRRGNCLHIRLSVGFEAVEAPTRHKIDHAGTASEPYTTRRFRITSHPVENARGRMLGIGQIADECP